MTNKELIQHFPDLIHASVAVADLTIDIANDSIAARGAFMFVISGGRTPNVFFETIAESPHRRKMPWGNMHIFWADERCVPDTHSDSNYNTAFNGFISKVPVLTANVHPIVVNSGHAEDAAKKYEQQVQSTFDKSGIDGSFPVFDMILLGMGADGHTASLFPRSPALKEKQRWFVLAPAPSILPEVQRITMTLPVINNARNVVFLVSGKNKKNTLSAVMEKKDGDRYPAARVQPQGNLYWFLDDSSV